MSEPVIKKDIDEEMSEPEKRQTYDPWIEDLEYLTLDRIKDYLKEHGMVDWIMDTLSGLIQRVDNLEIDVDDAYTGQIRVMYNNYV